MIIVLILGDLVQQRNPTCWVDTYQGGLSCCHHKNVLLDQHQTQPEELLTYQMKFRFYYQAYKPATQSSPASHKNLLRMWHQTEVNAGEYDITQCPPGIYANCISKMLSQNIYYI